MIAFDTKSQAIIVYPTDFVTSLIDNLAEGGETIGKGVEPRGQMGVFFVDNNHGCKGTNFFSYIEGLMWKKNCNFAAKFQPLAVSLWPLAVIR